MNSPVVISNHLRILIDEIRRKHKVKQQYKEEISTPVKPGDNYVGEILEINTIDVSGEQPSVILSLIAKLAPTDDLYRNFMPVRSSYEREVYVYNVVLPELVKFQEENNLSDVFAPFAKCYHTLLDDHREIIVLENMKHLGYRRFIHQQPVNYKHAALVVETLGKLHALSFAMRKKKPETFKKISDIKETFFNSCFRDKFNQMTRSLGTTFLKHMDTGDSACKAFKKLIEDPSFVYDELLQADTAEEYAVICHGDTQVRNILFRYENELDFQTPTGLCLLDWQTCRLSSPILDLTFFICACTDKPLRDRHYQELLQLYYDSLSTLLVQLGVDPEESFPMNVFQDHLKKFFAFGLFVAVWLISVNLNESNSVPDISGVHDEETIIQMLSKVANNMFFIRIRDLLDDFVKYGYDI